MSQPISYADNSNWETFSIDTKAVPKSRIWVVNEDGNGGEFQYNDKPLFLYIRILKGYISTQEAILSNSIAEYDYFRVEKISEADVNKKLTATITKNGIWGDTDEITVLCGESSTDYECNLLELDGYTPVKGWTDTNQKLIDLLATDRMNQYRKPSLLFNCTFEGGSPAYHNLIQFNFLDISNRLFMPIHWVYGAVDRVVEADLVELFTGKQAQTIEKRYQDFSGRMVLYAKAEVLGNPAVLLLKVWAIADTEYLISEDVHLMLSVVNTTNVPVTSATVKVTLPTGVNYIGGATSASGNELYFSFANIAANQESLPTAFTVQSSIGEDYTIPCEITVADGQAPENTEINAETGLPYSQAQILLTWYDPQFGTPTECIPTKKPLRDLPGVSVIFGRLYYWESLLYLGIEIRTDAPLNNEKLIVVHPNSIPTLEWGAGYTFPYGTHVLIDIIPITYTPINGYIRYMAINTGVTFADFLATQDLSAWKLYFEGTTLEAQLNIYHNF